MEGPPTDDPRILLNENGEPFGEELDELGRALDALDNAERERFRNANADAVARSDRDRLLVVAGPGARKTHLFLARIEHWLEREAGRPIYVATFVRKLIKDLDAALAHRLAEDARALVSSSTLHGLARSLVERNGGAEGCKLGKHVRVVDERWAKVLWDDALSFHPDLDGEEYTRKTLDAQLHTGDRETSSEWAGLWATYLRLAEFYNAVGFAHMIVLANEAAIESPELIEHEFWIVDEYQDFNPAEDRLVRTPY